MSRLVAEGPFEPGTATLVDADTNVPLHYGGESLVSQKADAGTNIDMAVPGMRVRKRWFPGDQERGHGSGIIVAVEPTSSPYGPRIHVLWSEEPNVRSFFEVTPSPLWDAGLEEYDALEGAKFTKY